jgi:hypothetical protein
MKEELSAAGATPSRRGQSPSRAVWVLAYLFGATWLPFFCLRKARAIGNLELILAVSCGLLVHFGSVIVLGKTDGNPMQIFVLLTALLSSYLIVMWQYLAGRKVHLWTMESLNQWRLAGFFFAGLIAFAFASAIVMVQLGSLTAGASLAPP